MIKLSFTTLPWPHNEKGECFQQTVLKTRYLHGTTTKKLKSSPIPYIKKKLKRIKYLNIRNTIIKLLEENIRLRSWHWSLHCFLRFDIKCINKEKKNKNGTMSKSRTFIHQRKHLVEEKCHVQNEWKYFQITYLMS